MAKKTKQSLFDYDPQNEEDAQELQQMSLDEPARFKQLFRDAIEKRAADVKLPDEVLGGLARAESNGIGRLHIAGAHNISDGGIFDTTTGYLVARFGGDPRSWPEELNADIEGPRIERWLNGARPLTGVKHLAKNPE